MRACVLLLSLLLATSARAAPPARVLRIATVAPSGTGWAHLALRFAQTVRSGTGGAVQVKWYFGGIAGDETEQLDRISRGQLDGLAGSIGCATLARTMRVVLAVGLIQNRGEGTYVLSRLRPRLESEFEASGFELLVLGGFGNSVLFTRRRVATFKELQQLSLSVWDKAPIQAFELRAMGLHVHPFALDQVGRAYDDGRVDGMATIPTAALAFQWSARTHYLLDLPIDYMPGCMVVTSRAFDSLTLSEQGVLRAAGAELAARFDALQRRQDSQLLNGLFGRQGLKREEPSFALRAAFETAARAARQQLGDGLVPASVMNEVLSDLAAYRRDH